MSDVSVNHSEPEWLVEVLGAAAAGGAWFVARLWLKTARSAKNNRTELHRCDRDANMLYASGEANGLASPVSSFLWSTFPPGVDVNPC